MVTDIRFSGFGGQGIIRSAYIVGKACSLFENKHATMTQSFGPEARGSACSSQLVVSDSPILYPYVNQTHILVAMSQEAYDKFLDQVREDGTIIVDQDLVKPADAPRGMRICSVPATRTAEALGNKIVANITMLGFFTAVTNVVSAEALKEALPGSVPDRALELNLEAFEKGYEYGLQEPWPNNGEQMPLTTVLSDRVEKQPPSVANTKPVHS
jgi:2-oxoglutarate ferredoxin oxidoreductase subunit gamma